jgi:hypothetical protein
MKKITVAFAAILLFISCQNNNAPEDSVTQLKRSLESEKKPIDLIDEKNKNLGDISGNSAPTDKQEPEKTKQVRQTPPPKIDWDKKIIKNASLNLEVKDYAAYNTSLREKIKQFGGYIAQEEQNQSEYKIENTLMIKVPVDQFDDAINNISAYVKELKEKKITSQDVTTEFIDTRSRMETKRQVRQRYLDLLKQARNMEEILNVQSVVNGVQEEIESAAGRIEYLSHASSYSTITLTFYQVLNEKAVDNDKPSFATRVGNAFSSGWQWIGELSVALVSIWPLLLLFFTVFVFYKRTKRQGVKQA